MIYNLNEHEHEHEQEQEQEYEYEERTRPQWCFLCDTFYGVDEDVAQVPGFAHAVCADNMSLMELDRAGTIASVGDLAVAVSRGTCVVCTDVIEIGHLVRDERSVVHPHCVDHVVWVLNGAGVDALPDTVEVLEFAGPAAA